MTTKAPTVANPSRTYRKLTEQWKDCSRCSLSELARSIVIGHGDIPADVMFIGEAPGKTEDILGRPFVGPAGKLLREILAEVESDERTPIVGPFRRYITNIVACAPWLDSTYSKYREPTKIEAAACSPRVAALVELIQPKAIVLIGKVSKEHFKPPKGVPSISIVHPATILHSGVPPINTTAYHSTIHRLREFFQANL